MPTAAGLVTATANEILGDSNFSLIAGKQPGIRQIASGTGASAGRRRRPQLGPDGRAIHHLFIHR
jgi:hypothetical protein